MMLNFLSFLFLQYVFTFRIPFLPKSYFLYTQSKNDMFIDKNNFNSSMDAMSNNITRIRINEFLEKIKKKNEDEIDTEIWDDGEVEW